MQRVQVSLRIHPDIAGLMRETAAGLQRSESWAYEAAAINMHRDKLGHLQPGQKLEGENDGSSDSATG